MVDIDRTRAYTAIFSDAVQSGAQLVKDLADFQAEAIARGYTHDFAVDAKSAPPDIASELRIVETTTVDGGTDPGDDVTIYLIESRGGPHGYLILSDSFHTDPRKAAFIGALLSKQRGGSRSP